MPAEKPFSFDAAAEMQRRSQLKSRLVERYAPSGRFVDGPAVLSGGSGTVDTTTHGAAAAVRYARFNSMVVVEFEFSWPNFVPTGGTPNPGGGTNWVMNLPVPCGQSSANERINGRWLGQYVTTVGHVPANNYCEGWVYISNSLTTAGFLYRNTAGVGAASAVGSLLPWDWTPAGVGNFNSLSGFFIYEAEDLYSPT